MNRLINGEALEQMQKLIDEGIKVDAIICDPPYGTTACKWDSIIPLDEMWDKLNQLCKDDNTPIVLFSSQPFTSKLTMSNIKNYKYDWIWEKSQGANFATVKFQPYKVHEVISVFTKNGKKANYYPQMTEGKPYISGKGTSGEATGNMVKVQTKNSGQRYPRSIQHFKQNKNGLHPTQKPVELMEYLVKTYTQENDTVLDFTMGSGSTGVACKNLNRNFIGIELDKKYYEIAKERITNE